MTGAGATLRGSAAVMEVAALLTSLREVDQRIEEAKHEQDDSWFKMTGMQACSISGAELKAILNQRRDRIINLLENKGIHIRPDVVDIAAPRFDPVAEAEADEAHTERELMGNTPAEIDPETWDAIDKAV